MEEIPAIPTIPITSARLAGALLYRSTSWNKNAQDGGEISSA